MNDDHLLVGCVDGKVFYLDVDTGSKMLTYSCGGHLFSTPTAARVGGKHLILLGSHDCYLHAIENGQILWKTKFNSALASSPFVVYGEVPVCIATETAGLTTLVDLNSGKKLLSYKWNGETFSSPVAQNGYLLQGCRDNFLYCLKMSWWHWRDHKKRNLLPTSYERKGRTTDEQSIRSQKCRHIKRRVTDDNSLFSDWHVYGAVRWIFQVASGIVCGE